MKEISKDDVLKLPSGTIYIIYNPLTNQYKEETASLKDIAHNKYCYNNLKFYLKEGKKDE